LNFWSQLPFVRISLAWILGIIIAFLLPQIFPWWMLLGVVVVFLVAAMLLQDVFSFKFRHLSGVFILISLISLSVLYLNLRQQYEMSGHFSKVIDVESADDQVYILRLLEDPQQKTNSYKAEVEVVAVKDSVEWTEVNGKIILYFEKDSVAISSLRYGDYISIYGKPNEIAPPSNPGQFNYKRYLERKKIYHQLYLKTTHWIALDKQKQNPVYRFALNCREYLLDILLENGIKGKEYAVASAILLGYSDKIDAKLLQQYSGAGAMHILCVSGLHVGIVYVIFSLLLFFLGRTDKSRLIKSILLILLIWSYAVLTGLSPSVMRASAMFSLVAIGQNLRRDTNIFNTLSASAFILFLVDPMILFDLGFQLSYSAVLGIVLLQPPMHKLFFVKNKILDKLWSITTVSIAAQIGTLPISLYYFHQFPNYFILTNILVIPASGAIIYSGIAVMLFSFFPFLSSAIAYLLTWMIKAMNFSIGGIESLPGSVTKDIFLSAYELIFLYIIIISLIAWVYSKHKKWMFIILSSILIMTTLISIRKIQQTDKQRFICYSVNKSTALEFSYGKQSIFLCDTTLLNDYDKQSFFVEGYRNANGIKQINEYALSDTSISNSFFCKRQDFIRFEPYTIACINQENYYYSYQNPVEVDLIILSGKMKVNLTRITDNYKFKLLLFDSSVPFYRTEEWKQACQEQAIPYHFISEKGAFSLSW
jgi:competence protein ComEC